MKRNKKTYAISSALAASAIVAVAVIAGGCGSSSKDVNLGFVYATTDGNFAQEMALGAQAAADHTDGVDLHESAPNSANGPAEVQLFQSAIRTAPDGIAMETLFPDLFVNPLNQASQADVPQIAVDTPPPKGTDVTTFVGNSNTELGQDLAKALLAKIPKGTTGEILVGTDTPGLPVLELRNDGFESYMKKARPGITFVDFDSKQDPTDNFNTWSSQVQAHPDALAYVGPGSQDAVSMAQIEKKTGKHYLVGADDLDPIALQGVKDGTVYALVSPEHWLKGYIAMKLLAANALDNEPLPEGWWNPGALVVDGKNVDEILARQKSDENRYEWFKDEASKELATPDKYIKPIADAN